MHPQSKNPSPQYNNNPLAGPQRLTSGARPLPPGGHLDRASALENMTENAIGIETGSGIGNERGIGTVEAIEVATEETFPLALEHIKSLDSQLRTPPPLNLIANLTVVKLGETAGGTGTMEVAPGGTLADEITVTAAEVSRVEVRVEVVLREAGQDCPYVVLRQHRRRMGIRADRVGIGGWFSVWDFSSLGRG